MAGRSRPFATVLDLFSGAGGLATGFLSGVHAHRDARLVYAAEIDDDSLSSCIRNLDHYSATFRLASIEPAHTFRPLDLTRASSANFLKERVDRVNELDYLIGGPPCQGFSHANRQSRNARNPYNALVERFLDIAIELRPRVMVLENVVGINSSVRQNNMISDKSVVAYLLRRLKRNGYMPYHRVLNAADFGVPQNRYRFFVIALRDDVYEKNSRRLAGGPFPVPTHGIGEDQSPYTTVRGAISDLPTVGNGTSELEHTYKTPKKMSPFLRRMRAGTEPTVVRQHFVSKQSDLVIKRYRAIKEGQNWAAAPHLFSNYHDLTKTHSNIYRRLSWDEPSVTIGHYRKSMLIHPQAHRNLSLREAARLQSLPDWFTFSSVSSRTGTESMQQQLANTVSFLLSEAVASHLATLIR